MIKDLDDVLLSSFEYEARVIQKEKGGNFYGDLPPGVCQVLAGREAAIVERFVGFCTGGRGDFLMFSERLSAGALRSRTIHPEEFEEYLNQPDLTAPEKWILAGAFNQYQLLSSVSLNIRITGEMSLITLAKLRELGI